jgi:hypothetical protein
MRLKIKKMNGLTVAKRAQVLASLIACNAPKSRTKFMLRGNPCAEKAARLYGRRAA